MRFDYKGPERIEKKKKKKPNEKKKKEKTRIFRSY